MRGVGSPQSLSKSYTIFDAARRIIECEEKGGRTEAPLLCLALSSQARLSIR
jgi:hypothetical protein